MPVKEKPVSKKMQLNLRDERQMALDFATQVYKKFDKMIKSIILFGSTAKQNLRAGSDIDIVILIDDATIQWDQELIAWYREELGKIAEKSSYSRDLHINTVKLTTWWNDLMRGDPIALNIIRYGESVLDFGGYFEPLKVLLAQGRIKSTPEAIYTALQRAPQHMARSATAMLGSIEGLYWAMVDSSQAALMMANLQPPSPEHVAIMLKEAFVDKKMLDRDYVAWFADLHTIHKRITHGDEKKITGQEVDLWTQRTDKFVSAMAGLINSLIEHKR